VDANGRGPAWANSLFEDNAEFGLGIRLGIDARIELARTLLRELESAIGADLVTDLLEGSSDRSETGLAAQRERVEELRRRLVLVHDPRARDLEAVAGDLIPASVWIVGGDGWAYDIGFGGLDHVLASGHDVNVLVLNTEVYSNTGGQASKATSRGAVAKFAAGGKDAGRKDLGMLATMYGQVYVAQVAMGADMPQTVKAFAEAEAWPGPSLLIAYSTCIAHGIDMSTSMSHMRDAVDSGYWPLWRFDPRAPAGGDHPFRLDSKQPKTSLRDFAMQEARFAMLGRADPDRAGELMRRAQEDVDARWHLYEQMANVERGTDHKEGPR
jgi:pyruvate-ferredoxin/flavodoxin oxidoreductase